MYFFFTQKLKNVEKRNKDIDGFDLTQNDFRNLCIEAWKDKKVLVFYNDGSEKKSEG